MFLNAKNKGQIRNKEIYVLNMIYKMIESNCQEESNEKETRELTSIYYKIVNRNSFICKGLLERSYYFQNNNINQFNVLAPESSYTQVKKDLIYYWQQDSISDTIEDIAQLINTSFLSSKQNKTREAFEIGELVSYNQIGRICFVDSNSSSNNYEIKDSLGNVTTNQYDIHQLPNNQVLIVSKNIISFGDLFVKIKKLNNNTPVIVQGIFEEQFETQFE